MGVIRKILLFVLFTSLLIFVGRLAGEYLPPDGSFSMNGARGAAPEDELPDSTNALPDLPIDTTGAPWREKLFIPLAQEFALPDKQIRRRQGYWEVIFPKGKPIHEYALAIEKTCRSSGIRVVKGVELRPSGQGVEYHLETGAQVIKLRASLGRGFMAGSARLAIVFTRLDSLKETQLAALEAAKWEKTLVVDPHSGNPVLKKIRYTHARNELLAELPMEPSSYPYLNPGKHALFIHHTREDVARFLAAALDSLPKAKGFASKHGDRAIENQPLLDKLFRQTAAKRLLFLDLTASPRSLTRQVAGPLGARYRLATVDRDSLGVGEELAHRAAIAQRTGEALWVIAYSATAFRLLEKALAENEARMAETGLELVTASRLSAAPERAAADATPATKATTPAARAARKPAAK